MKKRGLELTVSFFVLMTLGIIVLIGLILLFTGRLHIFSGILKETEQKNNLDLMIVSCNSLSSSQQEFAFCCEKREFEFQEQVFKMSCKEIREKGIDSGKLNDFSCDVDCSIINSSK
jgi:hypothetical protein